MKKFLFILVWVTLFSSTTFGCELRVGMREMPPYSFTSEQSEWQGSDVQLFKSLSQSIGCSTTFIPVTFSQGLSLLKTGDIDAMSQLSKIESRFDTMHFLGPLRKEQFNLLTTPEVKFDISELEQIKALPYIFAKRKGTYLGKAFDFLYHSDIDFSNKFIEINNSIPRSELLKKGRVIGYFEEIQFKEYQIANGKADIALKQHPIVLTSGDVYLGFSKASVSENKINTMMARFAELQSE